jgi:GDPmannose 4,6-dehydratase
MSRAIILGASGQDGFYLGEILRKHGVEVHAFGRKECDVGVQGYVFHEVARLRPDYVFHLAAISSVAHEFHAANHRAIVDGTAHVLEAVKLYRPTCRVFITGSILQLKGPDITPTSHRRYDTIYAAQRNASVELARYYRQLGIRVYVGYLSHHDSPRRPGGFLAKKLARLALQDGAVTCLDPYDRKEWNHARDMMGAVWRQVNSEHYEAVLGSCRCHTVLDFLSACMRYAGREPHGMVSMTATREYSLTSVTRDYRFADCFTTSMPELAAIMVEDARSGKSARHP